MLRILVVLTLLLPGIAGAEVWRWRDAEGRVHYSNVPGRVPAHAAEVRGDVGYLAGHPVAPQAGEPLDVSALERLRTERKLRRRLAEIQAFYDGVRRRQRARLEALWPNSTILPDWMVADQWMALGSEEAKIRAALAALERRDRS